ncbi:hypothetical protein Q9L58_010746 [Maublancomyces gigas]|uniref:Uncharacterized protein n=1 Tax=Discina gigas TaxID=1032678 RepID=A0ABR3G385_9PEZI
MHQPNAPHASATAITAFAAPPHPPVPSAPGPITPISTPAPALSANSRAHPVYTTRCSAVTADPSPTSATALSTPLTPKPLLLPLLGNYHPSQRPIPPLLCFDAPPEEKTKKRRKQ